MAQNTPSTRRSIATALVLACGLSAPGFAADATYRVVARSGQFAPGGGFFSSFGAPVISANGRVAFKGSVVGVLNNSGVWSEGAAGMNNLQSVIRRTDVIPGVPATTVGSIDEDSILIMNASGAVAFETPIAGLQAAFGDNAILKHDENGVTSLAMPGQLVSLPCGGVNCQRWLTDIDSPFFAFNNAGQAAFTATIAGTGVNADNERVLALSDGATIEPVMREGDPAPGLPGAVHGSMSLSRMHLNDNGVVLIRDYVRDGNSVLWSVWRGEPGSVSPVAVQGAPAPAGGSFTGLLLNLGEMTLNNAGEAVFVQTVEDNLGGVEYGLWRNAGAGTQAVCFQGMPSPLGLTYVQPLGVAASINHHGTIAYRASVQGPGVNANNDHVVIRRHSNGVETVVARKGSQAPGLPNGVVLTNPAFSGQYVLDDGRVVFRSPLSGPGVHDGNNDSLWIAREGQPAVLLLREGQAMTVGGQVKTVDAFTVAIGSGSESGTRSAVSQLGQTAVRIVFTDATEAIVVASPPSTCPGDANGDGVVDFADLNTILSGFGHIGDVITGDLDLDGDIDFTDLNAVLANFGDVCN